jgi:hypothetical protein
VADSKQFGNPRNPKILQFGDKTAGNRPGDSGHCAECEAMLADALDGTLSPADQALFDAHLAECGPCGQLLADARRGAAFLEILRHPAPEPPAALLERILAETSGSAAHAVPGVQPVPQPYMLDGVAALTPGYGAEGNVLPFRVRAAAAMRRSAFGQILLQPRLAMTAAMAFFSVTLTMNLMGIHPLELRASDLSPSSLTRDITSSKASVVRYYEGLRVVYELESRVHDMESAQDNEPAVPAGQPAAPNAGTQTPANATPANGASPSGGPSSNQAAPQPDQKQPGSTQPEQQKKPAPGPGSSRREDLDRSRRLFVADARDSISPGDGVPARPERTLV